MKNIFKFFSFAVFITAAAFIVTACRNDTIPQVNLENIFVTTMPTRIEYRIGEAFDASGMVVTAFFDNGTSEEITGYTLSGFDSATPGVRIITVSYGGRNAVFLVTVFDKIIESILVTTMPTRTEYRIGEAFDASGMVVTAFFDNGTSEEITGYTLSGFDSATPGVRIITVSYGGRNTVFLVTIIRTIQSISVTSMPDKTEYVTGEAFNSTGMVVTAFFDDGSSAPVTGWTLSGFDSATAGSKTLTVYFEGKTATFTVTVRQAEIFTITYAQLANAAPEIIGPVIHLLEREGRLSTAVVAVEHPQQFDPGSIRWYVNNNVTIGNYIVLNASDFGRIGEFFLTVEVRKDGRPYSNTVIFTVAL